MHKIELILPEELAASLASRSAERGLKLDELIVWSIQRYMTEGLEEKTKEWMPRRDWDALVRGEKCPLCELLAGQHFSSFGFLIAYFSMSCLRLHANQSVAGYCILVCKKHVREPYELSREERTVFFEEMLRAAQAIEKVFNPIKMNFELLGNTIPHLHCHIKPRYYGDPAPGSPIRPKEHPVSLTATDYDKRVRLIRKAL